VHFSGFKKSLSFHMISNILQVLAWCSSKSFEKIRRSSI
jgi:hypothetical protein